MSKEQEGIRPVRIYVALKPGDPDRDRIQTAFALTGGTKTHRFVYDLNKADMVISASIRDIRKDYSTSRTYVYLEHLPTTFSRRKELPAEVVVVHTTRSIAPLAELILDVWCKLKPLEETT